jgi:signal peptidase II
MWVGVVGTLFFLFRDQHAIWKYRSKRQKYLIDGAYQVRAAFLMSLIAFSMMLILSLFAFTSMRSVGIPMSLALPLFLSASALGLLFTAIAFLAGVLISHRSAGALYAFERHVEALLRGENSKFKLRKNDEHRRLIEVASRLSETLEEFRKKAG